MSSLRQLAQELKLSHATVSAALRDLPGVKSATRERVLVAAARIGYRANPLASALMGEMRRSRGAVFRGVLALVSLTNEAGFVAVTANTANATTPSFRHLHEQAVARGAARRAEELGFKLDQLRLAPTETGALQTAEILAARGIRAVLLTSEAETALADKLDWRSLTGVLLGVPRPGAGLNSIGTDHHATLAHALERLHALGYARPGLVLDASLPLSVLRRWETAYHAARIDDADGPRARPLIAGGQDTPTRFRDWFEAGKFDAVIAHDPRVLDAMREAGALVPRTHGFCGLDQTGPDSGICGFDLRAEAIGARGIDLLTAQVLRNEAGLPEFPVATLIPARWVPGETLRSQPEHIEATIFPVPAARPARVA